MKVNITHSFAEAVKPPATGQVDVWDSKTSAFGLRVSMGGTKTWIVRYRQSGSRRRYVLGRFPQVSVADARQAAKRYLGQVAGGADPARERADAKGEPTFADLADLYLERHAKVNKKPRSIQEDIKTLNRELLPAWGPRKVHDIRKSDVVDVLDTIIARNKLVMANRTRALMSKIFNFAIGRDYIEYNPCHKVMPLMKEHSRDRVLTDGEVRSLWLALEAEPARVKAAFRLALWTVARRSEILGVRWSELDLDGGWWTLPAERSKNGLAHRIPLVPSAVALLRTLQEGPHDAEYVFRGGRTGQPVSNPQKWLARIRNRAGLADFRLHDIRRTVASSLTGLGVSRLVVSKLLNHVETGVTAVYDRHSYDAEKRGALLKWERRLLEIVEDRPAAKVVALR